MEFSNQQVQLTPGISDTLYAVENYQGTQQYLDVLGIKLLQGRPFTTQEAIESSSVLLINETLAAQIAPDGQAIGKQIYRQGQDRAFTVIGIVNNLDLHNHAPVGRIYRPNIATRYPTLVIETQPYAAFEQQELNRLLEKTHPQIKVFRFNSTESVLEQHTQDFKVASIFTLMSSVTALFLAGIGIYGVFSYSIALQRFEFGVRMAIGATPLTIVRATLKDNLLPYFIASVLSSLVLLSFIFIQNFTSYNFDVTYEIWLIPQVITFLLMTVITLLCVRKHCCKPCNQCITRSIIVFKIIKLGVIMLALQSKHDLYLLSLWSMISNSVN